MGKRFLVLILLLAPAPAYAQAELLVIPFLGLKLKGHTSIPDLEQGAGAKKSTFGVSGLIIGNGIFGVEGDLEHTPHFFERETGGLIAQSNVTTLMGNVVFAVPKTITRDSLRPFVVGGVGLMHAHIQTIGNVFNTTSNLLGLDAGGGVIGFLSPRAGVRFELRHFKNLTKDNSAETFGSQRLSFWRLGAGLVINY